MFMHGPPKVHTSSVEMKIFGISVEIMPEQRTKPTLADCRKKVLKESDRITPERGEKTFSDLWSLMFRSN